MKEFANGVVNQRTRNIKTLDTILTINFILLNLQQK